MAETSIARVSSQFAERKRVILDALALSDDEYSDLSPKGSVDEGIKGLISEINAVDGVVTTSSCAGRISVFLEGRKSDHDAVAEAAMKTSNFQTTVPGGKGLGGRWLFVSHDMVSPPATDTETPLHDLFQLKSRHHDDQKASFGPQMRLIRFQFEPMILHVMTASLKHAQHVLSAALNAGFRESGVQSLKALDDPQAFPMVAIRTAGLSLSSIIGYADDDVNQAASYSMVNEGYLAGLLALGNERFKTNAQRTARFRAEFTRSMSALQNSSPMHHNDSWEDKATRAERKRQEGLANQKTGRGASLDQSTSSYIGDLFEQR